MPHFPSSAQTLLDQLKQDTTSGATQLALATLRNLQTWTDEHHPSAGETAVVLTALAEARPSMVVIGNALESVRSRLKSNHNNAGPIISEQIQLLENASQDMARHARSRIPEGATVMTHSASSAVLALFEDMVRANHRFSVICTQSSPGMEGHTLARRLDTLRVPVTLITDAQMGLFVPQADVIVTGCDCWLADHYFVNKSGTLLLALAASHFQKPFWVLADGFRDSNKTHDTVNLEELPAREMTAPEGEFITARNIYFETIPETLITGRISEQGVFSYPAGPGR